MDFSIVLKQLVEFFVKFCSVEVSFNGIPFTVGSVFIFAGLVGFFVWFFKGRG